MPTVANVFESPETPEFPASVLPRTGALSYISDNIPMTVPDDEHPGALSKVITTSSPSALAGSFDPSPLWSPDRKVPGPRLPSSPGPSKSQLATKSAGPLSPHLPRPPTTTSLRGWPTFSPLSRLSYSGIGTRKGDLCTFSSVSLPDAVRIFNPDRIIRLHACSVGQPDPSPRSLLPTLL